MPAIKKLLKVSTWNKNAARVKGYRSCKCSQGHIHHSRGEAGYCDVLAILKRGRKIKGYEIQKKFELTAHGKHITNHYPDFLVTELDGSIRVDEYKGFATEIWRIKMKMFKAQYPEIPYNVIKGYL